MTPERMTHRELIITYLHRWDNRWTEARYHDGRKAERGALSLELRRRGYDPCDIEDLRQRIS